MIPPLWQCEFQREGISYVLSNLLDHFIFLRTPSSQAWHWSTVAASTSFYLVQPQVKEGKEISRSQAKKIGSTQGYLDQPWISPEPSKNDIFQGFFSHTVCITEVIMSKLDIRLNIFWQLVFGIKTNSFSFWSEN